MTAVVFDDIDLATVDYLRDSIAEYAGDLTHAVDVHVSVKVPNPRTDRMVIVRRDGGRQVDAVRETARIGVQVWASTEKECADLANLVRALLMAMADGAPVCRVSETLAPSPVDDKSGQPMRYGTFTLTARGSDLAAPTPAP